MPKNIRVGLIGAGAFTTGRMLPGFQKVAGVQVAAIANRTRASAEKVAAQFNIPQVADDWHTIVEDPTIDAVFIGTPPYVHLEMTRAALQAGKHVLCQTRISRTAAEAREMLRLSDEAKGHGVCTMLAPPAPFYGAGAYMAHLIKSGFVGKVRHIQAYNMNASMADPMAPLSNGRNDLELYGRANAMQLGLTYDVIRPLAGSATRVLSQRMNFVQDRPLTPEGPIVRNPFPDEISVVSETESGALVHVIVNYSVHFAESRIEVYGDAGTLVQKQRGDVVLGARVGDKELKEMPIPAEHAQPWLVEDEFIRLVRGEIAEPSFSFLDGVRNMEFLEAAYVSSLEGRWVALA